MKKLALVFTLLFLPFTVFSQSGTPHSYYSSITWDQTSDNLKSALKTLLSSTETPITYSHASNLDTWDVLQESDLATGSTTLVSLFYGYDNGDGDTDTDLTRSKDAMATSGCSGLWNREHVFAKSLATPALTTSSAGSGTDLHNLRAIDCVMNSTRNNNVFESSSGNAALTTNGFYPGDDYRGDVARIIMYMYIRYPDQTIPNNVGYGNNYYHADIPDIFLDWNAADPVDDFETARNNAIANRQNSRNPFIDNPFLAHYIWGGPAITDWWSLSLSPRITINSSSSETETNSSDGKTISVTMSNFSSNVTLNVTVDAASTAEAGDYTLNTSSLNFTENGSQNISIDINNDNDNHDETVILNFSVTSGSANLVNSQHTISVTDDEKELIITEITDPQNSSDAGRYVEIYNSSNKTVDLSTYYIIRWTNGGATPQGDSQKISLNTECGSTLAPNTFCIISNDTNSGAKFSTTYGFVPDGRAGTGAGVDSNGDDNIALVIIPSGTLGDSSTYTVIDMFGLAGEDGTGTGHEFEDGRAERNADVVLPKSTWDVNDWEIDNDSGGGDGNQYAPAGFDPGYWDGAATVDTWTGRSSASWATAGNWSSGAAPAPGDRVFIHDATNDPDISTDISITDLTVKTGGVLDIEAAGSLSLSGNFSNSGTVTLNSTSSVYPSIKVDGTSSGNIIYNRWINSVSDASPTSIDPGWDLVGSPVVGASLTSSNFSQNAGNYAIQPYDNSDNTWASTSSSSVSTSLGTGYAMAKATAGTEAFTGTIETSDKDVAITNNSSGSGTQWNLVANPYPSYLALNSSARSASSATTDFITQNAITADVLGSGTNEDALWYWKGFEYGQYNNASSAVYIAPGQGFFIASKTGGGTLKFLESMQTTTGSDDFINGDIMEDNRGELFVSLNQNELLRETEVYFIEEGSDGSDPTYDARTFPMNDSATSIFTRHIEGDQGVDLSIQALAYSEMWGKVIPLGVNALGGEEMTISISHRTTPADLNIYLEDAEEGTMTNLLDGDYVLVPASDLESIGRFFIHMTADTMSNEDVLTSMLNAYKKTGANYITIEGLATQTNETKVSLYNILGREVLSTNLNNSTGTQTISTIGLSAGVYIIELESGSDRLTKKLLIQ